MFNIIDFCTYYSQNNLTIVNATDKILRMVEQNGTIVDIPSSVLPNGKLPKVYEEVALKLHSKPEEIFDGSLFIHLKAVERQVKKYVYEEIYKPVGDSGFCIISKIVEYHMGDGLIIIGTTLAARQFGNFGVVEPIYLKDGVIRSDKFKKHRQN